MDEQRSQFLQKMYGELMNDINRHILVVWQSIGVLVGAFALLALSEKGIISLDFSVALIVLLSWWQLAHTLDAAFWYNRNLAMITNIERQFLVHEDLRHIHWYFAKHRGAKLISHFQIQAGLGWMVMILVLLFHFVSRVAPGFSTPWSHFEALRVLPYLVTIFALRELVKRWAKDVKNYKSFIETSPGLQVDTTGRTLGLGHGLPEEKAPGLWASIWLFLSCDKKQSATGTDPAIGDGHPNP